MDNYIKTKCEIHGKINPYSYCIDYRFKQFAANDEEQLRS